MKTCIMCRQSPAKPDYWISGPEGDICRLCANRVMSVCPESIHKRISEHMRWMGSQGSLAVFRETVSHRTFEERDEERILKIREAFARRVA